MKAAALQPEAAAQLGRGSVWHRRTRPSRHEFSHPVDFVMLPLRSLRSRPCEGLARNRRGLLAFHDADHGDGRDDALAWLDELLAREGIEDATGEAWLLTFPRVLGRSFRPVSFWWAHRADGSLAAVVAEVNNTFGQRHCYLLDGDAADRGEEVQARKVFHVSPFCRVEGRYRFRLKHVPGREVQVRIDLDDDDGEVLGTRIGGVLRPLTSLAARRAVWRAPWSGLKVAALIHWHALRLWLKRVPWHRAPPAPQEPVSR